MMVTVEEALQLIQEYVQPTAFHETLPVAQAMGHVLFEAVIAPISMPPFRQSAMDGYALCLNGSNTYQVIGEVKAGDHHHPVLNAGEAVRIFTGALVPDRANAVVMQEKTSLENNCLTVTAITSLN
ncbi:MAG: hypothetical protein R2793_01680 [Flavobacteriaceae bacterium]